MPHDAQPHDAQRHHDQPDDTHTGAGQPSGFQAAGASPAHAPQGAPGFAAPGSSGEVTEAPAPADGVPPASTLAAASPPASAAGPAPTPAQATAPVQAPAPSQAPAPAQAPATAPGQAWEAGPGAATAAALPSSWGSPVGALLAGPAALLATYAGALVAVLLAVAGASLMSSDLKSQASSYDGGLDLGDSLKGFGALLRGIAQLVGMGFLAPLHASLFDDSGDGGSARITLPVLLLPLLFTGVAYLLARRSGRRWPVGNAAGSAAFAAVSGLLTATLLTLVSRLTGFRFSEGAASVVAHSASVGGFLFCFVLTTLAVHAGRSHAAGRRVLGNHPLARDAVRALQTVGYHLGVFSAVFGVVLAIYVLVAVTSNAGFGDAVGLLLVLPLVFVHVAVAAFAQSALGGVRLNLGGSLGDFGSGAVSHTVTAFDYRWYLVLGLAVLGLLALLLASLFWASRRRVGRVNQKAEIASWSFLPVAYLLAGLVMLVLVRAGGSVQATGSAGGAGSLTLSAWTPLCLALLGLLVDVAARYLAPVLRPIVPAQLYTGRLFGDRPAAPQVGGLPAAPAPWQDPVTGTEPTAVLPIAAGAGIPAGAGATAAALLQPGAPQQVAAQPLSPQPMSPQPMSPQPMSPEARRRWKRVAIGLAALVLALVAGAIAVSQLNRTTFGPKHQAQAFLASVSSGDATQALAQMGAAAPTGNQVLLSKDVYQGVENRVTDYSVSTVDVYRDRAMVHALTRQATGASSVDLQLTRQGRRYGLFDNWVVSQVPTGHVSFSAPSGVGTVQVNGKDVAVTSEASNGYPVALPALPGRYTVKVPDQGRYLTGSTATVDVGWSDADQPQALQVTLNDQFTKDVQKAVNDKIDACVKTKSAEVDSSCPFQGVYAYGTITMPTWEVVRYPTVEVQGSDVDPSEGVSIASSASGQVKFSYLPDASLDDTGRTQTEVQDVQVYGTAKIVGDTVEVSLQ